LPLPAFSTGYIAAGAPPGSRWLASWGGRPRERADYVHTVEGNASNAFTTNFALGDGSMRLFVNGRRIDSLVLAFGESTNGEGDI
jgi:hypothetical protein